MFLATFKTDPKYTMEDNEMHNNNMISNLPLLFANGYPTSLEKITETQLENFIPFMVQCSLGHIILQSSIECNEPEWWPENVVFTIPFLKPKNFLGNWMDKMKEIVIICYQFHKSVFLLRFCNDLAAYEHASLRFINNYNSTTSLFDRRNNKLLVTFRNENLSYDHLQRNRKCLLQQKVISEKEDYQIMVEPAPFDIYLCDNCDAELYSKEAIMDHEKICNIDDVILCDTPEPLEEHHEIGTPNNIENNELRIGFLHYFNLNYRNARTISTENTYKIQEDALDFHSGITLGNNRFIHFHKSKRIPRRNRCAHSLSRCAAIPLSSPAGELLIRISKSCITEEYLCERLDRVERFCYAPVLLSLSMTPKYFERKMVQACVNCTFKKPQEYSSHIYVFPRKQFPQKRRTTNFLFLNSLLMKKCRPIFVRLKKICKNDIYIKKNILKSNLNIKLTRDTTRSSNWKIASPSTELIVDTIDLCSSEDDIDAASGHIMSSVLSPYVQKYCTTKSIYSSLSAHNKVGELKLKEIAKQLKPSPKGIMKSEGISSNLSIIKKFTDNTSDCIPEEKKPNLVEESADIVEHLTQPKPLHPSVFVLTNYMPSMQTVVSVHNEVKSQKNRISLQGLKSQKRENKKKIKIGNQKDSDDIIQNSVRWFPYLSNITSFNKRLKLSEVNNVTLSLSPLLDQEFTSRALSPPQRVASIDLTF